VIDTHCHIIPKFEFYNPEEIIKSAREAGVTKMICIGCDFEDIEQTLPLVDQYPEIIYAAIGLHPECVKEDSDIEEMFMKFQDIFLSNKEKIFGIGECGLDYHYSDSEVIHEKQRKLFCKHIELCIREDKPLIIHTRDAWADTFEILEKYDLRNKGQSVISASRVSFPQSRESVSLASHKEKELGTNPNGIPRFALDDIGNTPINPFNKDLILTSGIIHSFTGGPKEAKKAVELGFKLGINGIITFKNKTVDPIREAVKLVGLENIVLETDSPFLSPEPFRGKRNEPARIKEIAEYLLGSIYNLECRI
jgi:TatD DNase family protein